MAGLRLFTGNKLEKLALGLAELLRVPLSSPMAEEIIVVQSRGMERWLSLQLAQRLGIWSNFRFPFPNAFVHEIFGKTLRDIPEYSPFDPAIITWRIMDMLPSLMEKPGFEVIRRYLGDESRGLKLFQLSERIADLFDQYLLFRPRMVFRWEKGEEDHWQANLFRGLLDISGKRHRAALGREFLEKLHCNDLPAHTDKLPERVSVFGISALPVFYMEIFAALARKIRVNLFLMNPCREYWGDILSEWEIKRRTGGGHDGAGPEDRDLYMIKGNSLLASFGKMGRDFFDLINELNGEEFTYFEDPGDDDTLLLQIQSDILNLRDVYQDGTEKRVINKDDTSIQVHSCHSPMRETEVLYDRLLEMFERDPDLKPGDILVMTPDIELYAPFIRAVFDTRMDKSKRIPFSIADQNVRKQSEIIDTFFTILDLEGSRFGASRIISILECPAVRRRFGVRTADLDLIRGWVRDTRIRWGIDGQSRMELGLPPFEENTWQAGLKRLLLGYAMPGKGKKMFRGILPYDHIEGVEAQVLGRFVEFTEKIFRYTVSLNESRTLDKWAELLEELTESFFMPDEDKENEAQIIRHALATLKRMKDLAQFDHTVPVSVIREYLGHSIDSRGAGGGFISGGVTFCAMLPMRSIPFKVICLMGMGNDAYPRDSRVLDFDLIARNPRKGDRSRRNDDRYLFLETILSARKGLYISYTGQSTRDNSVIPPSVLVTELLDYIDRGFRIQAGNIWDHIVTRHRLQPFNPEYFRNDSRLFSYSEENFRAARGLTAFHKDPVGFFHNGLSAPDETWKRVRLDDLSDFFVNPARFLLKRRLNIHFRKEEFPVEDVEPLAIIGLEKYRLEQDVVKKRISGWDYKDIFAVSRAEGALPPGTPGESMFEKMCAGIDSFVKKVLYHMEGDALNPFDFYLDIGSFRLSGTINDLYSAGLVQYRYARIRPADRLRIWIHHLVLNSMGPDHPPCSSILMGLSPNGKDPQWSAFRYGPVEDSRQILEGLLETYMEGLVSPLHFFPKSSWGYFRNSFYKDMPHEEALLKARQIWTGNERVKGECQDPYYEVCFGNTDPFDAEFMRISGEIFLPLATNETEMEK